VVISEMADLLRDTRASTMTDGCLLGAITVGLALEAGSAARALRPSLVGAVNLVLFGGIVFCWLVAVFLLVRATRPVLNTVSELRWVTGAPLDTRPRWVTVPSVGADPAEWTWNRAYLLLGAARLARYRMQFADTWTYFTGGCFLAWTVILILGRLHGNDQIPAGCRAICQRPLDDSSLEPGATMNQLSPCGAFRR
jgi:hypothetical protein